ncbi:SRPBCC domain-containing protein [Roseimicrobium sp. ORNL1]|uniref:SRPBCC domain-containing protein n=1 Tax=Roseimicrobium sp. ORNL1 TaxID=2711231 RepID=UPI0013E19FDB|nr:SRPBCC domain-containing protein [Roseimicrobium sp. ORNL1]QIF02965.1 hypothetical protein G5S37_16030 [Roseimicrobium sp. ORNL1]
MTKPCFEQSLFIGAPAAEVWAALTTKAFVDQYYLAPLLVLELQDRGRIAYGLETPMIEGIVAKVDPPRVLEHTFEFAGTPNSGSVVTYEIEPVGDSMCLLRLTHMIFKGTDQMIADIREGWPVILSSLKTLLETGKPLPWPKD